MIFYLFKSGPSVEFSQYSIFLFVVCVRNPRILDGQSHFLAFIFIIYFCDILKANYFVFFPCQCLLPITTLCDTITEKTNKGRMDGQLHLVKCMVFCRHPNIDKQLMRNGGRWTGAELLNCVSTLRSSPCHGSRSGNRVSSLTHFTILKNIIRGTKYN